MKLNRDVTKKECPWLESDLKEGTTVFPYDHCTYGCIGPGGRAVSLKGENVNPFVEIPVDAITDLSNEVVEARRIALREEAVRKAKNWVFETNS